MQLAQELLDEYWGGELPVNVLGLAGLLGMQVITDDSIPWVASLTLSGDPVNGEHLIARMRTTESEQVKRFILAHQIGHYKLHLSRINNVYTERPENFRANATVRDEREANAFACALLMPKNTLKYAIEHKGHCRIGDLAKLFGVSEVAMQKRLIELKIIQA